MNDLVANWLKKAENDFKTGIDEMATAEPATDTICFHMQQCVEKYLKAFLVSKNMDFRRTHDIAELIESGRKIDPSFDRLYDLEADALTFYGTEIRYPDDFYMPDVTETKKAIQIAKRALEFVKERLEYQPCS